MRGATACTVLANKEAMCLRKIRASDLPSKSGYRFSGTFLRLVGCTRQWNCFFLPTPRGLDGGRFYWHIALVIVFVQIQLFVDYFFFGKKIFCQKFMKNTRKSVLFVSSCTVKIENFARVPLCCLC